jgi:hypothetical protein
MLSKKEKLNRASEPLIILSICASVIAIKAFDSKTTIGKCLLENEEFKSLTHNPRLKNILILMGNLSLEVLKSAEREDLDD